MLDVQRMDVDLSIVKKEKSEIDEYGPNGLLDDFMNRHDYNDCLPTSMACGGDQEVDWLNSFFDEPLDENMSGLNSALTDITHSGSTSVSQITSINCNSDILLDSYSTLSDDYMNNTMDTSCLKQSPIAITKQPPTLRNDNPFLSGNTNSKKDLKSTISSLNNTDDVVDNLDDDIAVKIEDEESMQTMKTNEICVDKTLPEVEKPLSTQAMMTVENKTQNQQKLLLFMNTPENRAKLAGTNFNIINANLLSKISTGQLPNTPATSNSSNNNSNRSESTKSTVNPLNLKKCMKLNNTVHSEHSYQDTSLRLNDEKMMTLSASNTTTVNASLQAVMARQQSEKKLLPSDILGNNNNSFGFVRKDRDSQEIDSGYESPSSSSGSSPRSPAIDLERKDSCETIQYIDIPPHERQPFYLSEEERRTLLMEGLPVPQGLPLNKSEERALKKVRRKIKNKISAQESRRKKKEYMESLEKKVDSYANENNVLKKKIGSLEVANRSLIMQVQKLQALVASKMTTTTKTASTTIAMTSTESGESTEGSVES